jgi:hypothetical protein
MEVHSVNRLMVGNGRCNTVATRRESGPNCAVRTGRPTRTSSRPGSPLLSILPPAEVPTRRGHPA